MVYEESMWFWGHFSPSTGRKLWGTWLTQVRLGNGCKKELIIGVQKLVHLNRGDKSCIQNSAGVFNKNIVKMHWLTLKSRSHVTLFLLYIPHHYLLNQCWYILLVSGHQGTKVIFTEGT